MKLDQEKVRLIITLYRIAKFNTKTISMMLKISRRRIQQIIKQYGETGWIPS